MTDFINYIGIDAGCTIAIILFIVSAIITLVFISIVFYVAFLKEEK